MPDSNGPLFGVKVVACSTAQAGTVPYMLMADLGAEIIKIEVPDTGDTTRAGSVFPGLPSTMFETCNRGVKSVTLNLKEPEAREILYKLVARADIFGQNFRPGAAEKNGYGYDDLKKVNPKLVVRFDFRIRAQGSARRSSGHRFDGAGAGRYRRGVFDARPADEDRRRIGRG
jgi:crotonobetainyl-CoA:carnitine CoA-transferase CaiB-like acyl-CoA transferase